VLDDRALVASATTHDGATEVRLADGVAPGQLLAALVGAGAGVRRFEVVTPSLHDIFVARVGREAAVATRQDESGAA
jgi:ABC-2 type transport system ATP-binding protein